MTIIDLKTMRESLAPPSSVVCLGNFDGLHVGHAALVRTAVEKVAELSQAVPGIASGACFFQTPPSDYFSPVPQLITFQQKLSLFAEMGLQFVFVTDFMELRNRSPMEYVESTLKKECHCVHAVCGFNFHFGKQASGDAESLKRLMNGNASIVRPVLYEGEIVSSSIIRREIASGNVEKANLMLGHPFSVEASVLHGKALGRTLGIPTVNQCFPTNFSIPKNGIYITRSWIDGQAHPSVSNIGVRPSVDDGAHVNCETHILDFSREIYGKTVKVEFLKRLRDEIRFDSLDELKAQIQKDIKQTNAYYKEA